MSNKRSREIRRLMARTGMNDTRAARELERQVASEMSALDGPRAADTMAAKFTGPALDGPLAAAGRAAARLDAIQRAADTMAAKFTGPALAHLAGTQRVVDQANTLTARSTPFAW
jgi:hypothetical protein